MSQGEMHQLELERRQILEEALEKAETGKATKNDWEVIYVECGLNKRSFKNEFNCGEQT
jgi:hypothetical protein